MEYVASPFPAVYVVKFRIGNLQQFVTIGRHGSGWNPETARVRAEELLKVAGQSERRSNSATTKKASKNSGPTFFDMSQRYLKEYSQPRKRETSYKGDCHNLARHVWPIIGDKLLADITRQDLSDLHIRMNGVPVAANRSLNLISHIFTMAEKWGIRTIGSNPCRGLDRYKERPRDRFLNSVELARLGLVLNLASKPDAGVNWNSCLPARQRIRVTAEDWRSISCIRLLLFTGARLGEILSLRWDYLNWDRGFARLPDSKTGAKNLALTGPALILLKSLEHICQSQYPRSPYVLPGNREGKHFIGIEKPWFRIRAAAKLNDVRIHDLRHTFASTAVSSGDSLYIVGAILGHKDPSTTQRYAHLAMDPVRQVADRTAQNIADLLDGGGVGASHS